MSLPIFYYLAITAVYILVTWAIYLPYRVGQLHFMAVANMAISAYFGAIAALHWGWSFWPVLLAGIFISALIGFLASFAIGDAPCFAVVIVGFTLIYLTKTVVENTPYLGGSFGLFNLPRAMGETASTHRWFILIFAYVLVLIMGFLIYRFDKSKLGRSSSSIFVDKDLAVSLGINVKKTGMLLQTVSSAMGGMAGVIYMYIMRNISPNHFTFHLVGVCMTMLFVGGYTTQWGPLLAAPILWGIPLILPESLQAWKNIIYAVLLILILVVKPEGVITRPVLRKISSVFHKKAS